MRPAVALQHVDCRLKLLLQDEHMDSIRPNGYLVGLG